MMTAETQMACPPNAERRMEYRISEDQGTQFAGPILEVRAVLTHVCEHLTQAWRFAVAGATVMVNYDPVPTFDLTALDADMADYLRYEAARLGITEKEVYDEEMAAEKRTLAKTPSREELKAFAKKCDPDPRHLRPDDSPF